MEKTLTKLQSDIFDCLSNGMGTKEIMNQLNCSEATIKRTRANKELRAIYDEKSNLSSELSGAVLMAIQKTKAMLTRPNLSIDEILALGKQLQELGKLHDTFSPQAQKEYKITVEYVEPQEWQKKEAAKLEREKDEESAI